jgi:NADH-quinone oxidoreductase subunit H
MNKALEYIYSYFIFPGFLFSSAIGLLAGWVDRKVTARVQWRVGPPWYQNFADVLKLALYKETLVPEGVPARLFLGMPLIGLASATLVSVIIFLANIAPGRGFIGDAVVAVYLLAVPSIALMIGAFASQNPLASLGASREMKLMVSYELAFIAALAVPVMKTGYTIRLGEILSWQETNGAVIGSASGFLSFLVMLMAVQAKLGFVPFDIPEAETEIIAGPYIDYSGKALAVFKLTKAVLISALPVFLMTLYFGGIRFSPAGLAKGAAEYLMIIILITLIRNTNPRVRSDQALRFFWLPITVLAAASVTLAYLGY